MCFHEAAIAASQRTVPLQTYPRQTLGEGRDAPEIIAFKISDLYKGHLDRQTMY